MWYLFSWSLVGWPLGPLLDVIFLFPILCQITPRPLARHGISFLGPWPNDPRILDPTRYILPDSIGIQESRNPISYTLLDSTGYSWVVNLSLLYSFRLHRYSRVVGSILLFSLWLHMVFKSNGIELIIISRIHEYPKSRDLVILSKSMCWSSPWLLFQGGFYLSQSLSTWCPMITQLVEFSQLFNHQFGLLYHILIDSRTLGLIIYNLFLTIIIMFAQTYSNC